MNAFVKSFVFLLCVTCVFSLHEDGFQLGLAKSPEKSSEKLKIPLSIKKGKQQKLPESKKLFYNHESSDIDVSLGQPLETAEVKIFRDRSQGLEKPQVLKRLTRATEPSGRQSTSTLEMDVNIGQPLPLDLTPRQEYVFYEAANGSYKLHREPASWTEARLTCYDEGAELASPENDALLAAMRSVLLKSEQAPLQVFTGVNDIYSKGLFTSLKGTPLSAMPGQWSSQKLDVNTGGNCLVMQPNGQRLDAKCSDMYPFICYKRLPINHVDLCGREYFFDKHTKSCYKVHGKFLPWAEAYATCVREGAYLAILNSDYEARTLAKLIDHSWTWAHIGFSYWRKDLWVTIHGETVSEAGFESWAPGEPNDYQEERCGSLAADLAQLVDIDCEDHPRPFICEKPSKM